MEMLVLSVDVQNVTEHIPEEAFFAVSTDEIDVVVG